MSGWRASHDPLESDGLTVCWRVLKSSEMANAVILQTLSFNNSRPCEGGQKASLKVTKLIEA